MLFVAIYFLKLNVENDGNNFAKDFVNFLDEEKIKGLNEKVTIKILISYQDDHTIPT